MPFRFATHLLALLSGILLAVGNVVLRDIMEHISDGPAGRNGIDRDLLVAAVLGENADERVDGALGARVERVFGHAEVFGCVGRHQDDASALVEMTVGLARHEELASCVEAENAVEFFL